MDSFCGAHSIQIASNLEAICIESLKYKPLQYFQVSLTLAAANIGYFMKTTHSEDKDLSWDPLDLKQNGRLEFFLFTTTVGVFIVMAMILMLATGLREKISENQTVSLIDK